MIRGIADIGNTRVKAGIFNENAQLIETKIFENLDTLNDFFINQKVESAIFSSTKSDLNIKTTAYKSHVLSHESLIPFENLYATPNSLGTDRIALMAAAATLFEHQNTLVFDFGTCITIDFLNSKKQFLGGNISPGVNMRFKALHQMTGKLPLSDVSHFNNELGKDTFSVISNGVLQGIQHEISSYIHQFNSAYQDLNVVFTGGDYIHFDITQKNKIFADPNFMLFGLYQILILNEK